MMTPESYGLQIALTAVALLLAALGAVLLFKDAREDSAAAPSLDLTDAKVRLGDGASILRFRLEAQPSGRTAFRAETRPGSVSI
jgi:hypothetical protein